MKFEKIIYPGVISLAHGWTAKLFCRIKYENGNLSITGVEGPTTDGNCKGSCGQIGDNPWTFVRLEKGWDSDMIAIFRSVWSKYHLNDLTAGSPAQEEFLRRHNLQNVRYDECLSQLTSAGLNPDASYVYKGKPYVYGSAHLKTDVPQWAIDFLQSLPKASVKPAWV